MIFETTGTGLLIPIASGPARPTYFANCPSFNWVQDEGSNVWRFSAVYGNPWTTAQMGDMEALQDCTLSIVSGYLQCDNTTSGAMMHGFRCRQVFRPDSIIQLTRQTVGTPITNGYAFSDLNDRLNISYNTNDVYGSGNAIGTSQYEINPGIDWDLQKGGTAAGSGNTWYTYTHTWALQLMSIVRADLGVVFSYVGYYDYARGTGRHNGCCYWYDTGGSSTTQWDSITFNGAVTV